MMEFLINSMVGLLLFELVIINFLGIIALCKWLELKKGE